MVKPISGSEAKILQLIYRQIRMIATPHTKARCTALFRSSHTSKPIATAPAAMLSQASAKGINNAFISLRGGGDRPTALLGEHYLSGSSQSASLSIFS